jgi:hypothetical protein
VLLTLFFPLQYKIKNKVKLSKSVTIELLVSYDHGMIVSRRTANFSWLKKLALDVQKIRFTFGKINETNIRYFSKKHDNPNMKRT